MKRYILIALVLFMPALCMAKERPLESLFSLNINYLITGLKNSGGGIGVQYERAFYNYFSFTGGFGHMLFKTSLDDVYCASVNLALFLNVYPFGEGLNKLYLGIGNGADFMNYFGGGAVPEDGTDTVIHLTPHIGYKLFCFTYLLVDFNIAYRINIISSNNYYNVKAYLNPGIQFNVGVNILLSKMLKTALSNEAARRRERRQLPPYEDGQSNPAPQGE